MTEQLTQREKGDKLGVIVSDLVVYDLLNSKSKLIQQCQVNPIAYRYLICIKKKVTKHLHFINQGVGQIKLTYYNTPARARISRLILKAGGIPFQDIKLSYKKVEEYKKTND